MDKIFISYSRNDEKFTLELAKKLKEENISVWVDQLDIIIGSNWDEEIEKALDLCNVLMVILSPSSINSDNVLDEIARAKRTKKNIIPILYKQCNIPLLLERKEYIDFSNNYNYEKLLKFLTPFKIKDNSKININSKKFEDIKQVLDEKSCFNCIYYMSKKGICNFNNYNDIVENPLQMGCSDFVSKR